MHTHALSFADRPLVTQNLLAAGMVSMTRAVSKLIPNDFMYSTPPVRSTTGFDVFKSDERSKLAYVGHLRGYRD